MSEEEIEIISDDESPEAKKEAKPSKAAQENKDADAPKKKFSVTRRDAVIGGGALVIGALAAGLGVNSAKDGRTAEQIEEDTNGEVVCNVQRMVTEFRGERQAGMYDTQQNLYVCSYDILDGVERDDIISLFKDWTKAAENMCAGYPVNEPDALKYAAPKDTGEAYDLGANALTITFGVGATFFEKKGKDRFGLKKIKPDNLIEKMRKFPGDALNDDECGGDLFIKCAAEDPQVAFHALRNMTRIAYGVATTRWTKNGFIRTYSPEGTAHAPRDLFGFRDGTSNPEHGNEEDDKLIEECVWIHADDPEGEIFENGTYMCWRSFDMLIDSWDEVRLDEQERVIGRTKLDGIPLSAVGQPGADETAEVDLSATDENGDPLIDPRSHIATLRAYRNETGYVMYRWGWNFAHELDRTGTLHCGMHTGGYARDPEKHFYQFLDRFRDCDMTDYMRYTGSALWLILPGIKEGDSYVGQKMFEATEK